MTPKVSVVIDNYNYGRYLPQALDSVLSQGFPAADLEVIVVDDGSTDDSREVLRRYAPRVRAVLKSNEGQASAFNRGIAEARGELVCLLDSDDVWLPGKLARVVSEFEARPEAGLVQHFLREADRDLKPLPQELPRWPATLSLEDFLDGRAVLTATSALAYRRELLLKALPIPGELFYMLDDFLTVHALFLAPGANIPEVLGLHRVHGANFCAEGYADPKKLATDFRMRRIFRENLERWLSAHGRRLSPRYQRLEDLELLRREVLYHAHEGRRGEALAAWGRGLLRHGSGPFGLFRVLSCGLAVLSPALYLSVYRIYARTQGLKDLRRRLLRA